MNKKQIIVLLLIALIAVGGWWFYREKVLNDHYLILGVPYYGIYNLYYKQANSAMIAAAMSILGYWGDSRISLENLKDEFLPMPVLNSRTANQLTPIKIFFEQNGYEAYYRQTGKAEEAMKEIKKFVGAENKIPVMVFQKRSLEGGVTIRVVIGFSDKEKKIIAHDFLFGNNYEIPYDDFEKMFSDYSGLLAAWPKQEIKSAIKGPDYSGLYPPRLEAMDKSNVVMENLADAISAIQLQKDFRKASDFYRNAVNDAGFAYLPPAFQVSLFFSFASSFISIGELGEAIDILQNRALPLNQKLDENTKGWYVPPIQESFYPYYLLSSAYLKSGQKNSAVANYKKMKEIIDSYHEKFGKDFDNLNFPPPIPELEKEISSN